MSALAGTSWELPDSSAFDSVGPGDVSFVFALALVVANVELDELALALSSS